MKNLLVSFLFSAVLSAAAAAPAAAQMAAAEPAYSRKAMDLRASMRRLFDDHLTWARITAAELLTGARDAKKAQDRLMKNQEEIGSVFKPFYGDEMGDRTAGLFKQHAQLLADYAAALKSGGDAGPVLDKLASVADETANLLSAQNPYLERDVLARLFRDHENDLKTEIDRQKKEPGALDVAQMDRSAARGREIADTLAFGLIQQFPDRLK